jgi:hypothetical protein
MPQIDLTTAFQDISSLGELREFFLAGAADGTIVSIEAGASLVAVDGAEIGRLAMPNPGTVGAAGTTTLVYPGSAQFVRYRVVAGSVVGAAVWVSGTAETTPPQINLTNVFQDFSALGEPREFFLAGAPAGRVVAVEAGDSLVAVDGVEVARLYAPNPSVSTAAGTRVGYAGSAQFLRYRVVAGSDPPGTGIWVTGAQPATPPYSAPKATFAAASSLLDDATQFVPPGSGNATDLVLWFGGVILGATSLSQIQWTYIGAAANVGVGQTLSVGFQVSTDGGATWAAILGASQVGLATTAGAHPGSKTFAAVAVPDTAIVRASVRPNALLTAAVSEISLIIK